MTQMEQPGAETHGTGHATLYALYGFLMLAGLLLCGLGVHVYGKNGDYLLLGLGSLGVIVVIALFPVASALARRPAMVATQAPTQAQAPQFAEMLEALRAINDRMLISDTAKRVAYRERDRMALRDAIRADIAKQDFEAALVLVDEMSRLYGYKEEAENFRSEIFAARDRQLKDKVKQSVAAVEQLIAQNRWADAVREATRVQRVYADIEETRGLIAKVREAREQYKQRLIAEFRAARQRDNVDTAWELLKELDNYLTSTEAVPLQQDAREIIARKRENLSVQFRLAVQEQEWQQALRAGEQIIRDFPNSKMADEVHQRIGSLRDLAAGRISPGAPQISAWEWAQQTTA